MGTILCEILQDLHLTTRTGGVPYKWIAACVVLGIFPYLHNVGIGFLYIAI